MGKRISIVSFSVAAIVTLFLMVGTQASAAILSTNDYQLTGKLEAKAAFFTNNAHGYTVPNFKAWDMFKERNMGYLEWTHNLKKLTGVELLYHVVLRGIYDSVYDIGPSVFRQAYEDNKAAFERYNLKYQGGIWEAYVNYATGPVNIRIGRQNLSWGNTDIARVIDRINPLDNTWGGTGTESLDDRRIPLWMIRLGYQASTKFGLEGFVVPGAIDATVGPVAPKGSPYGGPLSSIAGLSAYGIYAGFNDVWRAVIEPTRDMSSSRVGLKLLLPGLLGGDNSNIELSYQRTYWDAPAARFSTSIPVVTPGSLGIVAVEAQYPKVNVFGISGNYVFQDLDLIIKGDLAHIQGVPVTISALNYPSTATLTITPGQFTYRDFTSFGLSVERPFWIRSLNSGEKIKFTMEYYGNYCHNYDNRMTINVPDPVTRVNPNQKRYEQLVALSASSEYHMKIKVALAALYNPSGSWLVSPTLTYRFDNPMSIALGYSANFGAWTIPFAQDLDRDQVNIMLKYEF